MFLTINDVARAAFREIEWTDLVDGSGAGGSGGSSGRKILSSSGRAAQAALRMTQVVSIYNRNN
jgi:hypothetical protein